MVEVLEFLVSDRVESLQRASVGVEERSEAALRSIVTQEIFILVDRIFDAWQENKQGLRAGGFPATVFSRKCGKLLEAIRNTDLLLSVSWMPAEKRGEAQTARGRLAELASQIGRVRDHAAHPPRISATREQVEARIRQADERNEWVPMQDAIARLKAGESPRSE